MKQRKGLVITVTGAAPIGAALLVVGGVRRRNKAGEPIREYLALAGRAAGRWVEALEPAVDACRGPDPAVCPVCRRVWHADGIVTAPRRVSGAEKWVCRDCRGEVQTDENGRVVPEVC